MARPNIYSEQLSERILDRLEDGESLASICRDDAMPTKRTVLRWVRDKDDFGDQYELARLAAAHVFDDEAKELIVGITDKDSAIAARAKFEILRWRAGVHAPRAFGDRVDVKVEGTVDLAAIIQARGQAAIERRRAMLAESGPTPPVALLLAPPEAPNGRTDEA